MSDATEHVLATAEAEATTTEESVLASAGAEEQGKPEGEAQTTADEGQTEAGEAEGKPEEKQSEQEPEIQLPEGAEIDAEIIEAAKSKDPQKVIDALLTAQQKRAAAWEEHQKAMVATLKADKDFGGERFEYNVNLANRALMKFADPELLTLLKNTGLGNHPAVVKTFFRIGKANAEDSVAGTAASPTKKGESMKDVLARHYPTHFPDQEK